MSEGARSTCFQPEWARARRARQRTPHDARQPGVSRARMSAGHIVLVWVLTWPGCGLIAYLLSKGLNGVFN